MTRYAMTVLAGSGVVLVMVTLGAEAQPCATAIGCGGHAAPAPLLAAGIPAFAALGGGTIVHWLWRKFARRS